MSRDDRRRPPARACRDAPGSRVWPVSAPCRRRSCRAACSPGRRVHPSRRHADRERPRHPPGPVRGFPRPGNAFIVRPVTHPDGCRGTRDPGSRPTTGQPVLHVADIELERPDAVGPLPAHPVDELREEPSPSDRRQLVRVADEDQPLDGLEVDGPEQGGDQFQIEHRGLVDDVGRLALLPGSPAPPERRFLLSQLRRARNAWIVIASFPTRSRMQSAALPVGARSWNDVPEPWAIPIASIRARMTVVFPVPAVPDTMETGRAKTCWQTRACQAITSRYSSGFLSARTLPGSKRKRFQCSRLSEMGM